MGKIGEMSEGLVVVDGSPTISVVLVVKDEESIAQSLTELRPQLEQFGAPCIVVDASQGRLQHIEREFDWVTWIEFDQPLGRRYTISHQRNIGVRASTTNLVAFCDAGGRPGSDWLLHLLDACGKAEVVCGPVLSLDQPPRPAVNLIEDDTPVYLVCSANMAVHRSAFDKIGGFNEALDHAEDIDFGWRVLEAGFKVEPVPAAIMYMRWGDYKEQRRRNYRYGRSMPILWAEHPNRVFEYWRRYPDSIFYSSWIVVAPLAALLCLVSPLFPSAWLALLIIPIAKNRRSQRPFENLILKLTYGWGSIRTIPRALGVLLGLRPNRHGR